MASVSMTDPTTSTPKADLSAQTALLQARARRVSVLQEFHNDRARLERLTGAHADLVGLEIQP